MSEGGLNYYFFGGGVRERNTAWLQLPSSLPATAAPLFLHVPFWPLRCLCHLVTAGAAAAAWR
jgi:hypothetical protein